MDFWDSYYSKLYDEFTASADKAKWFDGMSRRKYDAFPDAMHFAMGTSLWEKRVLEIGCGTGIDAVTMVGQGAILTGIDRSKVACDLASANLSANNLKGTIINHNAEKLPFENNSFDIVYSFGVIMHTETPQSIIDEIYRVLKNGGIVRMMIYKRYSFSGLVFYLLATRKLHTPFVSLKKAWDLSESPGTKAYTGKELLNMLGRFDDIKITTSPMMEIELLRNSPKLRLIGNPILKLFPEFSPGCYLIEAKKREEVI